MVGCGSKTEEVNADENINDSKVEEQVENEEQEDNEFDIDELMTDAKQGSEELEKELYFLMTNNALNEFNDAYDSFDTEVAANLRNVIITDPGGIENAKLMKDNLISYMQEDEQEVYAEFYDMIIELEEIFSHLDWSD